MRGVYMKIGDVADILNAHRSGRCRVSVSALDSTEWTSVAIDIPSGMEAAEIRFAIETVTAEKTMRELGSKLGVDLKALDGLLKNRT